MSSTRLETPPILHSGPAPMLPGASRFLGHAKEYQRSRLDTILRAREVGDVVRIRLLRRELTLLFNPADIERVLVGNAQNYTKDTPGYARLAKLFGEGLLTSDGDVWKRQRRIVQPLFTRKVVGTFAGVVAQATAETAASWEEAAAAGRTVDVAHDMNVLTLRVVARALFHSELDDAACDLMGESLDATLTYFVANLANPLPFSDHLPTTVNRRGRRGVRDLVRLVTDLVEKRRGQAREPGEGADLVDRLIAAVDPESGVRMPEVLVRDEALTMLLAGHETTSNALCWTFALLAQHPDVVKRLETEVDALDADPTSSDDLERLTYTWQVIQEAMRLYPPVWVIARRSQAPDVLGGYAIPARAYILMPQYAVHRHPALWTDPERFDPERFASGRNKDRLRYAYFPFSGGQRVCIGDGFARLEATLALATLVRRFRFTRVDDGPIAMKASVTLRPADGLPVRLERR